MHGISESLIPATDQILMNEAQFEIYWPNHHAPEEYSHDINAVVKTRCD